MSRLPTGASWPRHLGVSSVFPSSFVGRRTLLMDYVARRTKGGCALVSGHHALRPPPGGRGRRRRRTALWRRERADAHVRANRNLEQSLPGLGRGCGTPRRLCRGVGGGHRSCIRTPGRLGSSGRPQANASDRPPTEMRPPPETSRRSAFRQAPEMKGERASNVANDVWQLGLVFARIVTPAAPERPSMAEISSSPEHSRSC